MSTHAAFLSAIEANPDDDLTRLVYADWFEENGEPERAEFIRVQLEQWNSGGDTTSLTRRALSLVRRNKAKWLHPLRPMEPHESGLVGQYTVGDGNATMRVICSPTRQTAGDRESVRAEFTRGFVRLVAGPLVSLVGGACWRCGGAKWVNTGDVDGETGHPISIDCPACSGTGRVPEVLSGLVKAHPVEVVRATDRTPRRGVWFANVGQDIATDPEDTDTNWLPWSVASLLPDANKSHVGQFFDAGGFERYEWQFDNDDEGTSALSAALVAWAKMQNEIARNPKAAFTTRSLVA